MENPKTTSSKWYGNDFSELSVEFVKMTKERVQIKVSILKHIF